MNIKKALMIGLCLFIILSGVNYLRQQFLAPEKRGETPTAGAVQFESKHDFKNSPYFAAPDFYNMQPNDDLILLTKFKTRQQGTGYTCAPVAAAMVVEHFLGTVPHGEMEIAEIMGTSRYNGTTVKGISKYFQKMGWKVQSSADTQSPKNYTQFQRFVTGYLRENTPIIVENVEWGGHYRVIIGYDTMGTEYNGDDVLIMADSFDLADQMQDGYNVVNAQKFYYMWFDAKLFASHEQDKPWVAARPE